MVSCDRFLKVGEALKFTAATSIACAGTGALTLSIATTAILLLTSRLCLTRYRSLSLSLAVVVIPACIVRFADFESKFPVLCRTLLYLCSSALSRPKTSATTISSARVLEML
ncbi:hypothetical protein LOK49_LG06G02175 [Camellia lanceoleosa]|uniref:Uncharacterized protein n=1 Tax=Camellia lanceoleosa TaxID=1840588 RepID=A0ACC0HIF6_9ERIC|nr:hypothetical protein LOK49_LG06G02175 [Camellia lanceoleosa]